MHCFYPPRACAHIVSRSVSTNWWSWAGAFMSSRFSPCSRQTGVSSYWRSAGAGSDCFDAPDIGLTRSISRLCPQTFRMHCRSMRPGKSSSSIPERVQPPEREDARPYFTATGPVRTRTRRISCGISIGSTGACRRCSETSTHRWCWQASDICFRYTGRRTPTSICWTRGSKAIPTS